MAGCQTPGQGYQPRDGDVVFQSFQINPLTQMIEGCTHSPISHCGIVEQHDGSWFVLEAVGPVKRTPLRHWIVRGRRHAVAVYRLKAPADAKIPAFLKGAEEFMNRPYDLRYQWDDQAIYCSELVVKGAAKAGITLGKMEKLRDLDWKPHENLIRTLENGPPPLDREMVTPVRLTLDPLLEPVFTEGYTRDEKTGALQLKP